MRGGRGERLRWILVGQFESPIDALEVEQPVTQNAEPGERLAHLRLDGAEILAHDDRVVADAFERKYSHQIVCVVAHVSPVRRVVTLWNPVKPEQAHDMVDA